MKDMGYRDTFIRIAGDCPTAVGVVPAARGDRRSIHVLQYELLAARPYRLTHADLRFEVHVLHKAVPAAEVEARAAEIRAGLLATPHPCLRASLLPKKYGWGVHYDQHGRIALFGAESDVYRRFTRPGAVGLLVSAIRSRRA